MARIYTKLCLEAILSSFSPRFLDGELWRCLVDNGISRQMPTRRSCRAGRRKLRTTGCETSRPNLQSRLLPFNSVSGQDIEAETQTQCNFHIGKPGTLNIQNDTFASSSILDHLSVTESANHATRSHARDSGPQESHVTSLSKNSSCFVPKIMVTNVMSLVPKILEVEEFINRSNVSLAFITETWFKSTVTDSAIDIPGYSVIRRDRSSEEHGGVCLYIKDGCFKYKQLNDISCCVLCRS